MPKPKSGLMKIQAITGMITTDLEHWKEYGVTTPAQYDRYMLEQTV